MLALLLFALLAPARRAAADSRFGINVTRLIPPTAHMPRARYGGRYCQDGVFHDVDLFLPMTPNDVALAPFMFRSIEIFMPCFGHLVVAVNPGAEAMVLGVVPAYAFVYVVEDPLPAQFGYLTQKFLKMHSDLFTVQKYILILETDLVLSSTDTPSCYFNDKGQVRVFCIPYTSPVCGSECDIWRRGTEHALGVSSRHECLLRAPVMIPRELFPALRERMEARHNKTLLGIMEDYFPGHSKGWEKSDILFSEYNIMHKFGMEYMPEMFEFIMLDRPGIPVDNCALHVGSSIKRNYDLANPKATSEYFSLATTTILDGFCNTEGVTHKLCPAAE